MKRDQLIILLQPYKNGLMPKKRLAESANGFARLLSGLCEKYPRLRFNVALPGYILECIDPLIIGALRDMTKRGNIEWLCMGYTEPFLSFSPLWLTGQNILLGSKVFTELTGETPEGFVPSFSNWEPSHIDMLNSAGVKYSVVSNAILAPNEADSQGYWITEHTGSSMAVFPARAYHGHNAPPDLVGWIKETFPGEASDGAPRMVILKYLYSLEDNRGGDDFGSGRAQSAPAGSRDNVHQQSASHRKDKNRHGKNAPDTGSRSRWLERISAEIDKHILELQPLRFKDVLGNTPPLGLHYFPSSLVPSHNEPAPPYFLNHLHCYDQLGIMQRKLMDACDSVRELAEGAVGNDQRKFADKLKKLLFFAQDINRFLPMEGSGFSAISDRLWTYGKLIDIERELYELKGAQSGVIRLTGFLRNGYKSIIMANSGLKLYLDLKNGAQVYALDYSDRLFNACAAYNPRVRPRPNVIVPGESRLAFCDRIFLAEDAGKIACADYVKGNTLDRSNFTALPFEYTFKNSPTGVRILMNCNGGFTDGNGRNCPLTMDKVFGLEKDSPALSYSYKLGNTSLTDYSFTFGVEIPLALPGCARGNTRVIGGKQKLPVTGREPVTMDDITEWEIEDDDAGVRIEFVTQKKVNIRLFSPDMPPADGQDSNCIILMINCPFEIEKSSSALFTGRINFKKRARGAYHDTL